MTDDDDVPYLVKSSLSQDVLVDGFLFHIEVYRLVVDEKWSLKIVDNEGNNHICDDRFVTESDARSEATRLITKDGPRAFIRDEQGMSLK